MALDADQGVCRKRREPLAHTVLDINGYIRIYIGKPGGRYITAQKFSTYGVVLVNIAHTSTAILLVSALRGVAIVQT